MVFFHYFNRLISEKNRIFQIFLGFFDVVFYFYIIYDLLISHANEPATNQSIYVPILGAIAIVLSIVLMIIILKSDQNSKINHMLLRSFNIATRLTDEALNYENDSHVTQSVSSSKSNAPKQVAPLPL